MPDQQSSKPTTVVETLRAAKAVIADPAHWTKGAEARIAKRPKRYASKIQVNDPEAAAWCALGALRKVDGPHELSAVRALAHAIYVDFNQAYAYWTITNFNDEAERRHREVMAVFDRAIKAEEKKEKETPST